MMLRSRSKYKRGLETFSCSNWLHTVSFCTLARLVLYVEDRRLTSTFSSASSKDSTALSALSVVQFIPQTTNGSWGVDGTHLYQSSLSLVHNNLQRLFTLGWTRCLPYYFPLRHLGYYRIWSIILPAPRSDVIPNRSSLLLHPTIQLRHQPFYTCRARYHGLELRYSHGSIGGNALVKLIDGCASWPLSGLPPLSYCTAQS